MTNKAQKPTNDNKDNGWKTSTTYRYLQNIKKIPHAQAMEIWKWQNDAKRKTRGQS